MVHVEMASEGGTLDPVVVQQVEVVVGLEVVDSPEEVVYTEVHTTKQSPI